MKKRIVGNGQGASKHNKQAVLNLKSSTACIFAAWHFSHCAVSHINAAARLFILIKFQDSLELRFNESVRVSFSLINYIDFVCISVEEHKEVVS